MGSFAEHTKLKIAAGVLACASFFQGSAEAFKGDIEEPSRDTSIEQISRDIHDWLVQYRSRGVDFSSLENWDNSITKKVSAMFVRAAQSGSRQAIQDLLSIAVYTFGADERKNQRGESAEEEGKNSELLKKNRPYWVRCQARHALELTEGRESITTLEEAVQDGGAKKYTVEQRIIAAHALGRYKGNSVDEPTLLKILSCRMLDPKEDIVVRIACARALGDRHASEAIADLSRVSNSPDRRFRAAAVRALDEILRGLAEERSAGHEISDDTLNAALSPLLKIVKSDANSSLRIEALEALELYPHKAVIESLIPLARITSQSNLKTAIDATLTKITGGFTPDNWEKWWNEMKNKPDYSLPKPRSTKDRTIDERYGNSGYYGIPLSTGKQTFVLDVSASMMRGLGAEKAELSNAIATLVPTSSFNVIFFNTEVHRWRKAPVSASGDNKASAAGFIRYEQAGGNTNLLGALVAAFGANGLGAKRAPLGMLPEEIYIFGDCDPTAGALVDNDEVSEAVYRMNLDGAVRIFTVAPGRFISPLAQTLARENNGKNTTAAKPDNSAVSKR